MKTATETPMRRTQRLGVEFWNDSCRLSELEHAVAQGAVGATSNPVIVGAAIEADPALWAPVLRRTIDAHPRATEDEIAWLLIHEAAQGAARVLAPVHERTRGAQGWLCVQVSPKLFRDDTRMLEQALVLAKLAPNIAIKAPATAPGLAVMEELIATGVPVNATVSFTVSQAAAAAEAMERGRKRRGSRDPRRGEDVPGWVTLMVGRVDDHVKRLEQERKTGVDPALFDLAGIAVFKKARTVFKHRGYRSRLLAAAYRHERHWTELVGPGVVQSIPYPWWTRFNASGVEPRATLEEPVAPASVGALLDAFPEFRQAYEVDGLKPQDFVRYGASAHTLDQFIAGYHRVLDLVRRAMLHG